MKSVIRLIAFCAIVLGSTGATSAEAGDAAPTEAATQQVPQSERKPAAGRSGVAPGVDIRPAPRFELPQFTPCAPESAITPDLAPVPPPVRTALTTNHYYFFDANPEPDLAFCAEWSPEFAYNGHHCCSRPTTTARRRVRRGNRCLKERQRVNFCEDMSDEQRNYIQAVSSGKNAADLLTKIGFDLGRRGEQSYCSVNNGFLVHGRPVVATPFNRVLLRTSGRCTNFGTDGMVGMIEWLGHKISAQYPGEEYSRLHLLVGDISTPRGGCLSGVSGRKAHSSHTSGRDADVGFLTPVANRSSPDSFHTKLDAKANWWFIKQIFANPFTCVKVIFLDRRQISRIARIASRDEDWPRLRRFLKHVRGHNNHLHVRIGEGPGPAGCGPDAQPELEMEDDGDSPEVFEAPGTPEFSPSEANAGLGG